MKKMILLSSFVSIINTSNAQTCASFDSVATLSVTLTANDTVYNSHFYIDNAIYFRAKYHEYSMNIPAVPTVDIYSASTSGWSAYNPNFSGNVLGLGDVDVQADFTTFSYPNKLIEFDISSVDMAVVNPFNVNGAGYATLPSGVIYNITSLSPGYHVQITGNINTVEFHGWETAIDNLCVQDASSTNVSEQEDNLSGWKLYPCPAVNSLFIETNTVFGSLKVYNMLGSLVMDTSVDSKKIYELNVSDLEKGVYFLELYSAQRKFAVKRFVKQ